MKKKLLVIMLICIMCFNSHVTMAYTETVSDVAGGISTVTGEITSSSTFYGTTKHSTKYVSVYACTYANVLDDEANPVPYEVARGETGGNKYCRVDQTHENFNSYVGIYYISRIDFVHKVYSGTTSSNKGSVILTYSRTIEL